MKPNIDAIKNRPASFKDADISCVKAIAQAAVNVELFTIPLYMTSMYSIVGTHQINGGNDFYTGRWWPGLGPSRIPDTGNKKAFNLIFSVFIEEMLHLQLASNMASSIGVIPSFTSPLLMNDKYGWLCYGTPSNPTSVIPHVLDLKDTTTYENVGVQLDAMNAKQVELFLAIEETIEEGEKHLKPEAKSKYFEPAPFDWWQPEYNETKLPLFGSIGWMYTCFWDYLEITYDDGTNLLDILLSSNHISEQRDEFNKETAGHPLPEYPFVDATIDSQNDVKLQIMNAINAITEQGEGGSVAELIQARWSIQMPLQRVAEPFRPSEEALKKDYPYTNDEGKKDPSKTSGQATARIHAAAQDHYEVFTEVQEIIKTDPDFQTWDQWHADSSNKWTADMLNPSGAASKYNIPTADEIAAALNELKVVNADDNYRTLSLAAVGTIKGITTQLDEYWKAGGKVSQFPSPAMYGSGDRVSICWAITGKVPMLWEGIDKPARGVLNHACQGMDLTKMPADSDTCAAVEIYHSCKGSNTCKTEGGCGFVQNSEGGGNCSSSKVVNTGGGCGLPLMSAPANNKCGGNGGCAVPISASQLFPTPGKGGSFVMQIFDYGDAPDFQTSKLCEMPYKEGEPVYDVAWKAYERAMAKNCKDVPSIPKPKPSALRLAFPPST